MQKVTFKNQWNNYLRNWLKWRRPSIHVVNVHWISFIFADVYISDFEQIIIKSGV